MPNPIFSLVETSSPTTIAVLIFSPIAIYLFLYHYQSARLHPDEPPIIPSRIPFVGHMLGMGMHGGSYVKNLGLKHPSLPIFTLPFSPSSRLYVVTDPHLATAVQRASKTLDFVPLVPGIAQNILGLDKVTVDKLHQMKAAPDEEYEREKGGLGFLPKVNEVFTSELLKAADHTSELTWGAARELVDQVNSLPGGGGGVDLLSLVRRLVTTASFRFSYGPGAGNPLARDPGLLEAVWDFDRGVGTMLTGLPPRLLAPKAYRGRERIAKAFEKFIESGGMEKGACGLMKKRVEVARMYGFSLEALARTEVSLFFAAIVNTATAGFWVLARLAEDQELQRGVREELTEAGVVANGKVSLAKIKEGHGVRKLTAVVRECLRLTSDTYSTRKVMEDVMLGERYWLKKGSMLQISGGTMHADPRIWGEDVNEFRADRFLSLERESRLPTGFRAFGGGKTVCPGRYFALMEILVFVSSMVTKFDMDLAAGCRVPEKEDKVMPVHVLEPKSKVMVELKVRDGGEILVGE